MSFKDISKSAQDVRANNYELAHRRMQQLQAEAPYSVDSYINMSTISSLQGNINDAVACIKKALQMDPFDYRPYYNLFVIYWRSNQHNLAFANLKKCLSILYVLKVYHKISDNPEQDLHRGMALWDGNTVAYASKIIQLINENKLQQANETIGEGLQKCIMKHHIYALGCIVDTKLNRQAQREQNARYYHAHLLRPVQIDEEDQNSQSLTRQQIGYLIEEFNKTSHSFEVGECKRYASHPKILFMDVERKTTINIESMIADLGGYELSCIKQQNVDDDDVTKQKQTPNQPKEHKQNEKYQEKNSNVQQQQQDSPLPIATQFISSTQKIQVNIPKQVNPIQPPQHIQINDKADQLINIQQTHETKQQIGQQKQQIQNQIKLGGQNNNKIQQKQQQRQQTEQIRAEQHQTISKEQQLQPQNQAAKQKQEHEDSQKQQQIKQQKQEVRQKKMQIQESISIEDELRQVNNQKQQLLYPVTHPNFQIKLIMADLKISQQLIGKMDPYVYYEYGQQKHKTTIAKRQGTRPRWQNQVKVFSIERNPTIMKVSVYDRQMFRWDDLVGTGQFQVIKCGIHMIPIFLKAKQSGQVVVYITKIQ